MELNGDTPLNKEDYFIGERGVTFVGYEMFSGEKLSFNETPHMEYIREFQHHSVRLWIDWPQ